MATITCGTGSGNFPQPGDPDLNNSILNAVPAFGGIDVTWTYPELLPEAVAHVRLYRSTNADPATAVLLRRVSGEFYYDKLDPLKGVTYYYWIKIVSVNGTIGDLIGPASAVARPTIEQTIEMLSGQINDSHLAQSLRDNIQRIDLVNTRLDGEVADRVAQYEGVLGTLNAYQADVEGTATLLADEVSRLDTADTAQINQINILGARAEDNEAMLLDEQRLRAEADQVMGEDLRILSASMGIESQVFFQPAAPIPSNPGDRWIDTDNGNAPKFWSGTEWVADPEITGAVYRQAEPPVSPVAGDVWFDSNDEDKAYQFLDDVWEPLSIYDGNLISAAVQNHNNTRIGYCMIAGAPSSTIGSRAVCLANNGDWLTQQALADAVKGVQITDSDGDSANVEQRMVSYKDDIGQLLSEYTVKVQTDVDGNKIVGGFGLTANGATVDAGFDVDKFWVGKLGNKRFPFIIDTSNNEVFMDEAVIRSLTFSKLRDEAGAVVVSNGKLKAAYIDVGNLVAEQAQSLNFAEGSDGWVLRKDGTAELNEITARGELHANSGSFSDGVIVGSGGDTIASVVQKTSNAESWRKPNTTKIDGNQIYTGDAYVDTLQLKGQAVTIPSGVSTTSESSTSGTSYSSGSPSPWVTALTLTIACTGNPVMLACTVDIKAYVDGASSQDGSVRGQARLLRGSTQIAITESWYIRLRGHRDTEVKLWSVVLKDAPGAGTVSYRLQVRATRSDDGWISALARGITALEVKR